MSVELEQEFSALSDEELIQLRDELDAPEAPAAISAPVAPAPAAPMAGLAEYLSTLSDEDLLAKKGALDRLDAISAETAPVPPNVATRASTMSMGVPMPPEPSPEQFAALPPVVKSPRAPLDLAKEQMMAPRPMERAEQFANSMMRNVGQAVNIAAVKGPATQIEFTGQKAAEAPTRIDKELADEIRKFNPEFLTIEEAGTGLKEVGKFLAGVGSGVDEWLEKKYPDDMRMRESFLNTTFPSVVGNALGFATMILLSGGKNVSGKLSAMLFGMLSQKQGAMENARAAGASVQDQMKAFTSLWNTAGGALEGVTYGRAVQRFIDNGSLLRQLGFAAAENAAQGGAQQAFENMQARATYDPEREILEGVPESAALEAVGVAGAVGIGSGLRRGLRGIAQRNDPYIPPEAGQGPTTQGPDPQPSIVEPGPADLAAAQQQAQAQAASLVPPAEAFPPTPPPMPPGSPAAPPSVPAQPVAPVPAVAELGEDTAERLTSSDPKSVSISDVKSAVDPLGNFLLSGDALGKILRTKPTEDIVELLQWSRSKSAHVNRNVGGEAANILRLRKIPVDAINWQIENLTNVPEAPTPVPPTTPQEAPPPVAAPSPPAAGKQPWEMTSTELSESRKEKSKSLIEQTKRDGAIPYVVFRQDLGGGKSRYVAVGENGQKITEATQISGPASITGKLFRRKDQYYDVGINTWSAKPGDESTIESHIERTAQAAIRDHAAYIQQRVEDGSPVSRESLEEYRGQPWADAALAKMEQPEAKGEKAAPGIVIKKMKTKRPTAKRKSIFGDAMGGKVYSYIIRAGGIRDKHAGEVMAMLGGKPPQRLINNGPKGKEADYLRGLLADEGVLPQNSTEADFYEWLSENWDKPLYTGKGMAKLQEQVADGLDVMYEPETIQRTSREVLEQHQRTGEPLSPEEFISLAQGAKLESTDKTSINLEDFKEGSIVYIEGEKFRIVDVGEGKVELRDSVTLEAENDQTIKVDVAEDGGPKVEYPSAEVDTSFDFGANVEPAADDMIGDIPGEKTTPRMTPEQKDFMDRMAAGHGRAATSKESRQAIEGDMIGLSEGERMAAAEQEEMGLGELEVEAEPSAPEVIAGQTSKTRPDLTVGDYVKKKGWKKGEESVIKSFAGERGQFAVIGDGDVTVNISNKNVWTKVEGIRQEDMAGYSPSRARVAKKKGQTENEEGFAAPTGPQPLIMPALRTTPSANVAPVSKRDVRNFIDQAYDVPIRGKGTHPKGDRLGFYKVREAVIRVFNWGDIETLAHEAAHRMERVFWGDLPRTKRFGPHTNELRPLDYSYPKKTRAYEGFAEYIRLRMMGYNVTNLAPNFHNWFNQYIAADPQRQKTFRDLESLYERWTLQGAKNRVLQQIDFPGKRVVPGGMLNKIGWQWARLRSIVDNDLIPFREALRQSGVDVKALRPSEDPFQVGEALKEKSPAWAETALLRGTYGIDGQRTGDGLKQAIAPVADRIKDWMAYAYSLRSLEYNKRGLESGVSQRDAEAVVAEFDNEPGFRKAAEDVTAWGNRLLDILVDVGNIPQDLADRIKRANPIWIHLKRVFADELNVPRGVKQGYANQPQGVKRVKGSGRMIDDLLRGMASYTGELYSTINKVRVAKAFAELAETHKNLGRFIEEIPAPMEAQRVSTEQIVTQLQEAGIDIDDPGQLPEVMTFFTQGHRYTGKDNVVMLWKEGKRHYYHLHPELYKAIQNLDSYTLPPILNFFLGAPTRMIRLGATGIRASFGLANPMRDAMEFAIYSVHTNTGPFPALLGLKAEIMREQIAKDYANIGGKLTGYIGQDIRALNHIRERLLANTPKEQTTLALRHPIDLLREVIGKTETATRLPEFKAAYEWALKQPGWTKEDALIYATNAAQDVTVNFTRKGSLGRWLNQVIAFYNPAVQGNVKFLRSLRQRPLQTTIKGLAFLTIPTLALWMVNRDEEWYRELPMWRKAGFWNFHIGGKIISIPKPFLPGLVFASIPELFIDSRYAQDPALFNDALKEMSKNLLPPFDLSLFTPIREVKENKNWAGRPIVSESMQNLPPEQQVKTWTPAVYRVLGNLLGVSPLKIEHLASGYTGGMSRALISSSETIGKLATGKSDEVSFSDLPVIGRFFLREPEVPQRSLDRFYGRLEILRLKQKRDKATGAELAELIKAESVARDLSDISKSLAMAKEDKSPVAIDQLMRTRAMMLQSVLGHIPTEDEISAALDRPEQKPYKQFWNSLRASDPNNAKSVDRAAAIFSDLLRAGMTDAGLESSMSSADLTEEQRKFLVDVIIPRAVELLNQKP